MGGEKAVSFLRLCYCSFNTLFVGQDCQKAPVRSGRALLSTSTRARRGTSLQAKKSEDRKINNLGGEKEPHARIVSSDRMTTNLHLGQLEGATGWMVMRGTQHGATRKYWHAAHGCIGALGV